MEDLKRFIRLDANNKVVGDRWGTSIVDDEVQSETGEIGQIMQADGSFITPTPTNTPAQPTLEDKVNYLYYKSMGVIQ